MVKSLLKQILEGIHYLHSNWILHRDLVSVKGRITMYLSTAYLLDISYLWNHDIQCDHLIAMLSMVI